MTNQRISHVISPSAAVVNTQHLLDTLPYAVAILDPDERCLMANQRWLDDYRILKTQLIGQRFFDALPTLPDDWKISYRRALSGEIVVNDEERIELADGFAQFLSWRMVPWRIDEGGQIAGAMIASHDVTALISTQITREAKLTKSAVIARKLAESLSQLSAGLSQANDEAAILNVISPVADQYGASVANLIYFDLDEHGKFLSARTVATQTLSAFAMGLSDPPQLHIPDSDFALFEMLDARPHDPTVIDDVAAVPAMQAENAKRTLEKHFNVSASAVVLLPLKTGAQWQGLLGMVWEKPQVFSPEFTALLDSIISILASVTASRRAYLAEEKARYRAEMLAQINAALSRASDEDTILSAVALFTDGLHPHTTNLSYTEVDEHGQPLTSTLVASRKDGQVWVGHPNFGKSVRLADYPSMKMWLSDPDNVVLIEDVLTDSRIEDTLKQMMALSNNRALASFPLYYGERWHGSISIGWPTNRTFSDDEKFIFVSLTKTISAVVASRRLYLQTLDNVARLRELDKLKDEFMSNMSHELRTPLNAIIGLSDVILNGLDGELTPRLENDVQTMFNAGQQLLIVVNDILDIAKIEAGKLELTKTTLDIREPIQEAIDTVITTLQSKGLKLETLSPELHLPMVLADRNRVQQVMLNLLSNAIKFTENGTIQVQATVQGNALLISVRDEGIGIKPEHHRLIFERFRQIEGALTRKKGGTGLGLPISKSLIELHGGTMWVESEFGHGATFYFTVPTGTDSRGNHGVLSNPVH